VSRKFTYANAGVDRELRAESKKALQILEETYMFGRFGGVVQLPYGNIFPFKEDCYLDFVIEEVGTKVLVAQLAEKYDTVAIDGVAMAVNDIIRSGAKPFALADNIHVQFSDPVLIRELLKGVANGAEEAECIVPGGEIGDVAEILKGLTEGTGFDIVIAAIGDVPKEKIIHGNDVKAGDVIVGLRSSGLHSNGISLARKILFKQWDGKYEPFDVPEGLDREVVYEVLEPTRIYVKSFLKVAEELNVKATVHITGDAYTKFPRLARFSKGIGFQFDNLRPQPIFDLIQRTAVSLGGKISDVEMCKTFNMGWGFAIIMDKASKDQAVDMLGKARVEAEEIGRVTDSEGVRIFYKDRKLFLQ
jgi:phosphoribosylformylglycinamidine cyclo-ligase